MSLSAKDTRHVIQVNNGILQGYLRSGKRSRYFLRNVDGSNKRTISSTTLGASRNDKNDRKIFRNYQTWERGRECGAILEQHPNACWVNVTQNMSLSAVFLVMAAVSKKGDETKAYQLVEFHSFP